ncbi:MAG: aminodeoxychorismate synthase component I, partial [Clostridium argentinense]|nr:aminodeoxychorismate synthase component I [Clostridium argentinense]
IKKLIEDKIKLGKERKKLNLENLSYNIDDFQSNFEEDEYLKTVSDVKEYIKNGDIYITNLTQRYVKEVKDDPFDIYERLRTINPAPFAAYMALEDFYILSSSPERFLKIESGVIETRPIKGTRPRGENTDEDERYKNELLESEKDKSELLMIVDLERNDLSKVCKPNTVKVTELFKLEEYSTVFHLVSTVVGEIKEEHSPIDCIKACFPGGSITGAPKIRSMEIIDELEKVRRNIYTGSIGYIGLDGNSDFNIVIRTALIKENKAYFGVGGGITYESIERMEYDETLDKARALMNVLK